MPTDPAPRGADAPDYAEADAKATEVMGWSFALGLSNLARAYLALRSPVPAEATSGAERQEVVAWNAMVDVLNEVAPGWADDWDGSTTIDAAVKAIRALRTPPAPLPREGATEHHARCAKATAVCDCRDLRHTDKHLRLDETRLVGVVSCSRCCAKAAGPLWVRWSYQTCADCYERALAALTPAAQPTTKETR